MSDYDNTNRGVLFKNDRKETDKHPDYTGKIDVGGTEYRLAAWIKDGRKGKFMSLSVSEMQVARDDQAPSTKYHDRDAPDLEDEIPF